MFRQRTLHRFLLVVATVLSAGLCVYAQQLRWLGTLGGEWSYAVDVSADGTVVVGESATADGRREAFYWSPLSGLLGLGTLGGSWSYCTAVTSDGFMCVGASEKEDGLWSAFLWTPTEGMVELFSNGLLSDAFGISEVPSVVVGSVGREVGYSFAVRWSSPGTPELLGTLGGIGWTSCAYGVSEDGSIIVGLAEKVDNGWSYTRAFLWTPASGMQELGDLGNQSSYALAVSPDGTVIVGEALNPFSLLRGFRWTASAGMQELLPPPGFQETSAMAVSAYGQVVVGEAMNPDDGGHAVRWVSSDVAEDLNVAYAPLLSDGSFLSFAAGVSPDGRYIVGGGYNATSQRWEAFLLDTEARFAISGKIDLQDYLGDITQVPIDVEVRAGDEVVLRDTLHVDPSGAYAIPGMGMGSYDLLFKASHWLRRRVTGVSVAGADVYGVNVSLVNGDIDGDNEVTLFDFGGLVAAFGSMPGDEGWNPDADLDGDEEVTLFDFGIIVRNFGAAGDD